MPCPDLLISHLSPSIKEGEIGGVELTNLLTSLSTLLRSRSALYLCTGIILLRMYCQRVPASKNQIASTTYLLCVCPFSTSTHRSRLDLVAILKQQLDVGRLAALLGIIIKLHLTITIPFSCNSSITITRSGNRSTCLCSGARARGDHPNSGEILCGRFSYKSHADTGLDS